MNCRIDIFGQKIWNDAQNTHNTRPQSVEIVLYRDGEEYKRLTLDANGDGKFKFPCLIKWKNNTKYVYTVDEAETPLGYMKKIEGYTITNTLGSVHIRGQKVWDDNGNQHGVRPSSITLRLMLGLTQIDTLTIDTSDDSINVFDFDFGIHPFADSHHKSLDYYIVEDEIEDYQAEYDGFNITNTYVEPIVPFGLDTQRATDTLSDYMNPPNAYTPLGGNPIYMCEKIVVMPQGDVKEIRWAYGVRTAEYFSQGGGFDITSSYLNGINITQIGDYSVYASSILGEEVVNVVEVAGLRNGTSTAPYLLIDYTTAQALATKVEGIEHLTIEFLHGKYTGHFELYEDIDMVGREWNPITQPFQSFSGVFNGNDKSILNLTINQNRPEPMAFISSVDNGTVKNLTVKGSVTNLQGSASGVVGVVTSLFGTSTLQNLHFEGAVTANNSTTQSAGGIVATINISQQLTVDGCSVNAEIVGGQCGGIVAVASSTSMQGKLDISNCVTNGTVDSHSYGGGIVGISTSDRIGQQKIENSISFMTVNGEFAGGIVGQMRGTGLINSCVNRGNVVGEICAGGISGYLSGLYTDSPIVIQNSYNTANVAINAIDQSFCGGINGLNDGFGTISRCYNVANVSASLSTYGSAGGITATYGVVEYCASIGATCQSATNTGRVVSAVVSDEEGILNKNYAFSQMDVLIGNTHKSPLDEGEDRADGLGIGSNPIKLKETYSNELLWDFDDIWEFANADYTLPVLRGIDYELQPTVLPSHLI